MTDSMITYTKNNWLLNYPDNSMTAGTTYAGISLQDKGSDLYALFSSSTATYAWLPTICPDGKYQQSQPSTTAHTAVIRSGTVTYDEWYTTTGKS